MKLKANLRDLDLIFDRIKGELVELKDQDCSLGFGCGYEWACVSSAKNICDFLNGKAVNVEWRNYCDVSDIKFLDKFHKGFREGVYEFWMQLMLSDTSSGDN
jgi:hypothetical protein